MTEAPPPAVASQTTSTPSRLKIPLRAVASIAVGEWAKVKIGTSDKPHVVFTVTTRLSTEFAAHESVRAEWTVHRRFTEFEELNKALHSLPGFPAKSIRRAITTDAFDETFLSRRARKLDIFLNDALRIAKSGDAAVKWMAKPLLTFLLQGGLVEEKCIVSQRTLDYDALLEMMPKWSLVPRRFVWRKFVLAVVGLTSSAKSSFVNHLFGIVIAKTGNAQIDTGYTVYESVSPNEFAKYPGSAQQQKQHFTSEELSAPLPDSELLEQDQRFGRVFLVLNAQTTIQRYSPQFAEAEAAVGVQEKLLRTVLINEAYLPKDNKQRLDTARRLVVIDSKGITQQAQQELLRGAGSIAEQQTRLRQFLDEVKLRALFLKLADMTLFLVSSSAIHEAAPQLAEFELSTIISVDGSQQTIADAAASAAQQQSHHPVIVAATGTAADSGVLGHVTGAITSMVSGSLVGAAYNSALALWSLISPSPAQQVANAAASAVAAAPKPTTTTATEMAGATMGNVRWSKTWFVVTKIDECLQDVPTMLSTAERQLWFDLGKLFGKSFKQIEPPTFGRVLFVSLPEHQHATTTTTRDLEALERNINHCAMVADWERRMDEAIVSMAEQLVAAMAQTTLPVLSAFQHKAVVDAKDRALQRLQSSLSAAVPEST